MAEFKEVARQWKRMCKKYWSTVTCHGCPIAEYEKAYEGCVTCETDVEKMEELVMTWAAEHLEPVYPTWREWLVEQGILKVANAKGTETMYDTVLPKPSLFDPIPADIAQKLGIQPKEEK